MTKPDGYHQADDLYFEIVAEYDTDSDAPELTGLAVRNGDQNLSSGDNAAFQVNLDQGKLTTTVVNMTGAQLPSTGGKGAGTLIMAGLLMMAGAGILLTARKRMLLQ